MISDTEIIQPPTPKKISGDNNEMRPHPAPLREPPRADTVLDITFETDALSALEHEFHRTGDAFKAHSPALQKDLWVLSHPDHVRHVLVENHANFTKGIGIER